MADEGYLNIDMKVSKANEKEDVIRLLQEFRSWKTEDIHIEKLKGGIINTMYCCWSLKEEKTITGHVEKIVVRIYLDPEAFQAPPEMVNAMKEAFAENAESPEDFFDHSQEIRNFKKLKGLNLGPELLAIFKNGLCYRYLHGQTLKSDSVRTEEIIPLVTKLLAHVHTLPLSTKGRTWNMEDFKRDVKFFPPTFSDSNRVQRLLEILPDQKALLKEVEFVDELLADMKSPMVFCHNDTKGENFIWDKETEKLSLVDWEHSFNNKQAHEIGGHFVSYNDVANSKPGQFPDPDFQKRWIRMYLEHWFEATGKSKNDVTDKDVESLYVNANKCAQMCRLLAGVGCLQLSAGGVFDCFEFCIQLLKDYFNYKDFVKTLVVPPE